MGTIPDTPAPLVRTGKSRAALFSAAGAVCAWAFACLAAAQPPVRYAVIGDYGWSGPAEAGVAALVAGWNPDAVFTVGDNNYDEGSAATIDRNIGMYYHQFISPYTGSYGKGDSVNRFFPALGNHDWVAAGAAPYLAYFGLPGNERYYGREFGAVHLFSIDSDPHEPDGRSAASAQAQWLRDGLARSTARWRVVTFHHPPYTSGSRHGPTLEMRWPFQAWGASLVISGHEHFYERLTVDGLPYIVNGLGGRSLYPFGSPAAGSVVRYNGDYGAMLITADADSMTLRFVTRSGLVVDSFTLNGETTLPVNVRAGWNVVSLPGRVDDPAPTVVFPAAVSGAFGWSGGYAKADTMRLLKGYWMRFDSSMRREMVFRAAVSETAAVAAGWNLIGALSYPVSTDLVAPDPPGNVISPYFGYAGAYRAEPVLLPGRGYWVKAAAAGRLILPSK